MKYIGSNVDCAPDRLNELMEKVDEYMASNTSIKMADVFEHIVECPASRFWVSEERAALVVSAMQRGAILPDMHPLKLEMFREIYSRYLELRHRHPDWTLIQAVREVVWQPAPRFYMHPLTAKKLYYGARRQWRRKKMQSLMRHVV